MSEDLLRRNKDSAQAARDVSVSLDKLGAFLAQRGDADEALKQYRRGLEIREDLWKRNPNSARTAHDVMMCHYKLGELDLKLTRFESAIVRFGAGMAVLDEMIERGLNAETSAMEKAFLVKRLQCCANAPIATGDWNALLKTDAKLLPELLSFRATALAGQGRLADVAQAGGKLRELEPKTDGNLYNAACAYGLCAGLAKADDVERRKYIDLALACLKEAVAAGYKDFDHMRQDADLIALHGLPEFEGLFPKASQK
jgi:tetratricopeptide (TPR) repeat protein